MYLPTDTADICFKHERTFLRNKICLEYFMSSTAILINILFSIKP